MNRVAKRVGIFIISLLVPAILYADGDPASRDKVIDETLGKIKLAREMAQEIKVPPPRLSADTEAPTKGVTFPDERRIEIQRLKLDDAYLDLGLSLGYLNGNTAYDWNHHTSELEYPMDNWMAGGKLTFGYKNLAFHADVWVPIEDYAGFNMKDKDWNASGLMISYTKSKAYMEAVICDSGLRYDFYSKKDVSLILGKEDPRPRELKFDQIKMGALLGYKFEQFIYDMFDIWYWPDIPGTTTHQAERVLTYKIKYYLPYLGVAADLSRENLSLGINIKYSFYPTAEHVDHHLLRDLTLYADYDKNGKVWMGSIYGFWKFMKNWKLKAAIEGTFIRIDGRMCDETRNPGWDGDISTDASHWLFSSGIEYRF